MTVSVKQAVEAFRENSYNATATAHALGVSRPLIQRRIRRARELGLLAEDERFPDDRSAPKDKAEEEGPEPDRPLFSVPGIPDPDRPVDELLDYMLRRFDRVHAAETAKSLVRVPIHDSGPVGIAFIGDPHLDNQGCHLRKLMDDINTIKATPGMMAGSIGDYRDNWVGRLSKLYAQTDVTESEGRKLVEWFFTQIPWLFLIAGNHDLWNCEGGNVLDYITRIGQVPGRFEKYDLRMKLEHPNGRTFTIHARHDFPGGSQFNPAHGLVKETLWNYRDHILVCGDRHHSGYAPVWHNDPDPRLCHAIRVGTYKWHDTYAQEKGFKWSNYAPSAAVVIDPDDEDPVSCISYFPSVKQASDFLTWKRSMRQSAAS